MSDQPNDTTQRLDKVLGELRQHQLWLDTREKPEEERQGKRADFSGQDLSCLFLAGQDFTVARHV